MKRNWFATHKHLTSDHWMFLCPNLIEEICNLVNLIKGFLYRVNDNKGNFDPYYFKEHCPLKQKGMYRMFIFIGKPKKY